MRDPRGATYPRGHVAVTSRPPQLPVRAGTWIAKILGAMHLEDLGLIGNCQLSALVERSGSIVWACLPRFDAEPMFGALLDAQHGGRFSIAPPGGESGR